MDDIFPTQESDLAKFVDRHKQAINVFKQDMLSQFKILVKEVWANPAYTPMEIIDQYGASGQKLFEICGVFKSALEQITEKEVNVIPEGYTWSPLGGGRIKVVEPPEPEPEPEPIEEPLVDDNPESEPIDEETEPLTEEDPPSEETEMEENPHE